jgi:hypothetical protein
VHLNQPRHADELLGSFLRHRRPPEWQVFAEVVQSRPRYAIYLGDMPHTWIGAEYARTLLGMLMREEDDRLSLLPGAPQRWVEGEGLSVTELPTAYGKLTMAAKQDARTLRLTLGSGLRSDARLHVSWPTRRRPTEVSVDDKPVQAFDANGVTLQRPFKNLTARW